MLDDQPFLTDSTTFISQCNRLTRTGLNSISFQNELIIVHYLAKSGKFNFSSFKHYFHFVVKVRIKFTTLFHFVKAYAYIISATSNLFLFLNKKKSLTRTGIFVFTIVIPGNATQYSHSMERNISH